MRALPIYGGAPYGDQIRGLKNGAKVVVGTPGRVVDHMNKGTLDLSQLDTLVLDEADEMISMGFKDDLEFILNASPRSSCNTWLFSATMSREVRKVADTHLRNPAHVHVNRTEIVPEAIEQIYYRAHESDKPEILCKLIEAADEFYGLIFCQTKALVMDLTQYLNGRGYGVDCLHGDMDQNARERTMKGFRDRVVKILVCTDVASRGLDVKDITHVVNYSLPRELDNYVHRIGRTARSGKTGFAMSLVTPSHRGLIPRIESMTKSKMREGKLPTRKDIGMKKISQALARFKDQPTFSHALDLMDDSWKSAIAEMSRDEIAARFLTLSYPEVFSSRKEEAAPTPGPGSASGRVVVNAHARRPAHSERPDRAERSDYSDRRRDDRYGRQEERRFNDRKPSPWGRPVTGNEKVTPLTTGVIIQAKGQDKAPSPANDSKPAMIRLEHDVEAPAKVHPKNDKKFHKKSKPAFGDGTKPHRFDKKKKGGFDFKFKSAKSG